MNENESQCYYRGYLEGHKQGARAYEKALDKACELLARKGIFDIYLQEEWKARLLDEQVSGESGIAD